MSRPSHITDEQILAPARELFLEKGIRATTAEVAKRAGIAEGSIFKRFKTKADLFQAAMVGHEMPSWLEGAGATVGKGDLRENLYRVGLEGIAFFRRHMPLMMMKWSNPDEKCGGPDFGPNPPPLRGLKKMTAYFEAEMRLGRLKRHDPEILARLFGGGLQSYVFFEMVLKAQDELPLPAESYVRGLVELLWRGVDPKVTQRR